VTLSPVVESNSDATMYTLQLTVSDMAPDEVTLTVLDKISAFLHLISSTRRIYVRGKVHTTRSPSALTHTYIIKYNALSTWARLKRFGIYRVLLPISIALGIFVALLIALAIYAAYLI